MTKVGTSKLYVISRRQTWLIQLARKIGDAAAISKGGQDQDHHHASSISHFVLVIGRRSSAANIAIVNDGMMQKIIVRLLNSA